MSGHIWEDEAHARSNYKQTELGQDFLQSFTSAPSKPDLQVGLKDKLADLDRAFLASSSTSSSQYNVETQLEDEQRVYLGSSLRSDDSSQSDDFLVFRATAVRLKYSRHPPSSLLSSAYIDHKPTGIHEWLGNVEKYSDMTDSSSNRVLQFKNASDSQQHVQCDTLSTSTISPNMHATPAGVSITPSHPYWLIPLLGHPQYSIIVEAWSEFWSEDPVDQGDSTSNSHQSTSPSSGSASEDRSGKRPVQGSKRKRESDEDDESGNAKKSRPSDLNNVTTTEESKSFLACHFYKMNARLHLTCMQKTFNNISALVQHLKKHHKLGPDHCSNCWMSFANQAELRRHSPICKPTGGIPVDQLPNVLKTRQDAVLKWYWIWEQLFPNFPRPETPYTGAPEYILIQHFVEFFSDRYAPTIAEQYGADPSLLSVTDHIRAAARDWASTPAHMLIFGPLPTPPTTVSEDASTDRIIQLTGPLANRSDGSIAPSLLLGNESLLRLGEQPMENIEEAVDAPTSHTDTVHITGNSMTDLGHRSGPTSNAATHEELNASARNPEEPFLAHPLDEMSPERWNYASGMTEAEHIMELWKLDNENGGNVDLHQPVSWEKYWDEPMEQD